MVDDATAFLNAHSETRQRFDRVTSLVEGFESPFGLELLATVHWVMNHDSVDSEPETIDRVHAWNERKLQFSSRQFGLAVNVLTEQGWAHR